MKIAERIFHSSSIIKRGASVTALQRPCSGQTCRQIGPAAAKTCRQIDLQRPNLPPDGPAAAKLAARRPCSGRCGLRKWWRRSDGCNTAAIRPHDIAALQITISRESQDQISNSKDPAPLPLLQEPDHPILPPSQPPQSPAPTSRRPPQINRDDQWRGFPIPAASHRPPLHTPFPQHLSSSP